MFDTTAVGQCLNSIFISPRISYSFRVKKIKTHLHFLLPAQHPFYTSRCAQFCIWKGMCLLSDEQLSSCSQSRWQILATLLSGSHLNSSWENTLWRRYQMVFLMYLRSRLAVLALSQHLLSGYFLSSCGLRCQVDLCPKTYTENKFSVTSSLASHYREFWQTGLLYWATPQCCRNVSSSWGYLLQLKWGQGVSWIHHATPITLIPLLMLGEMI